MKMGRAGRLMLLIAGGMLSLVSIIFLILYLRNPGVNKEERITYAYQMKPVTDYQVSLVDNPYFEKKVLPAGMTYIRNYVDHIDIALAEEFQSSEEVLIQGSYRINAYVSATLSSGMEVWRRKYEVEPEKSFEEKVLNTTFGRQLQIDLASYEEEFASASSEMGVTLNFELQVVMEGMLAAEAPNHTYEIPIHTSVSMPMYNAMFEVTVDNSGEKADQQVQYDIIRKPVSVPRVILYIILFLVGGGMVFFSVFKIQEYDTMELKKKRLLKVVSTHKGRLVELISFPDVDFNQSFEVKTMDALIQVAEDLNRPIFYIYDEQNIVFKSLFFVIARDEIYLYEMCEKGILK